YIPVYAVPNAVTEFLVGGSSVPEKYKEDRDIGPKAVQDDWQEYLAAQDKLKMLILFLLLLFLFVPLWGLLCACCCGGCRRTRRFCPVMRYCCSTALVIAAFLMLGKTKDVNIFKSNSEYVRRLYESNYDPLLKRLEAQSDATRAMVQAEAFRNLSEVLRNMQGVKPLLEELRDELPVAKGLAFRFRDALRVIKLNLKIFLTLQCQQQECVDFYRDNEIRMLDEGCLHYDRLPPMEDFTKTIESILADIFVNYPLVAAQQIAQAIRNPMDNLLDTVKKHLHKGGNKLQQKYELRGEARKKQALPEIPGIPGLPGLPGAEKEKSPPAVALRKKLGPNWYRTTMGWLLMLLFLPILLFIALLVTLFSCKHSRRMLCAFIIASFILFSLNLLFVFFFLVHGALAHQIFCAGKSSGPKKTVGHIPRLRSGDARQQCVRNESLYEVLVLEELHGRRDTRQALGKLEGAPKLSNLSFIYSQTPEPSRSNLFSYNSSQFTRHMCRELVPEPKPGALPELISRLDNLTRSVGSSPFLLNQTIYLRAVHKELGQPLGVIIQRVLDKLRQLDHLLSGGFGRFSRYMSRLLIKIKQGDLRRDEVPRNMNYFVDSGLYNGTQKEMAICSPQARFKIDMDRQVAFDDLCKRIANPMNAIWFWLLVFTLLLLPAICCSNYIRCHMQCCGTCSQDTLVSCGEENFVAHSTLPMELESHCHCYRYLPVT
ncbi:hypothetical protein KR054_002200, partial [Drosophila jambulina]